MTLLDKTQDKPVKVKPGVKLRDAEKMQHIPIQVIATEKSEMLRKPEWLKIRLPKSSERIDGIKKAMRSRGLSSVCEEASCPNLSECFNHGTATFMILGAICTRRCPFCDVGHGRPLKPDAEEPEKLALTIRDMKLKYVVITSVDRDDLRDGGAQHFADCITQIRKHCPGITIEILVPDFKGRMDRALEILIQTPPDVFNHNLETAPRLYKLARPGAGYKWSLELLRRFKEAHPDVKTKSGLMVGLGEEISEIEEVLRDLREHNVDMLTVGQYLQPSKHHLPVKRYVPPAEFDALKAYADEIGFSHAASGPFVRSSYHADQQAAGKEVK
ncbi:MULTISPECIES: lipoyl synthase [unclassified Pseudoalteromonas]|uniref:lipoyl synthase n=1 Tax=unclassified Pseudoalteromonas TaxID=194690 RepID=UPI0005A95E9D|nr:MULTISPECIES: lipoyl synthase [unclassified Pseudoalteromonas]